MKNPKSHKITNNGAAKALLSLGAAVSVAGGAYAEEVDTELLLLVDVSGSIDSSEYNLMMGGYENAFRSNDVLAAIQSGSKGSVAVSLVFWSGNAEQTTGVGWTKINDSTSANAFADAISNLTRPYSGMTAIGSGISHGATLFGTETGQADNGFTSAAQIIDVSGDGEDNDTPPSGDRAKNVRDARDAAIAAGVDMINGLPIGNAGGALNTYYQDNVIAGSAGGVAAFTQVANTFADVQSSLEQKLQSEISAGAAVPEPAGVSLIAIGSLMFVLRRDRK